ncbi:MAG: leucine-rich repeat protein [Bacteroidales bacterium]|nr:leucine-rich repeat protein [Bacteroidales bacterium]
MKTLKRIIIPAILTVCVALSLFAAACAGGRLDTPRNVEINLDNYTLSWDRVEHARGYEVEARSDDTGESEYFTVASTKISCSLQTLAEGAYRVRVRATAGSSADYSNSDWSAWVAVNKDYYSGCSFTLINNNTEYEVSGWTKPGDGTTDIVIPKEYRGKPVVGIGEGAFKSKSALTSVVIEEDGGGGNLRYIGKNAFYACTKLESINIPESVTELGEGCFHSCRVLTGIKIPSGVKEIPNSAFLYCRGLADIDLGCAETIGSSAFYGCGKQPVTEGEALTEIYIPDTVKTIGDKAFADCSLLETVSIGCGVETISDYAFQLDSGLASVEFREDSDGKSALREIGEYAFASCTALESVTLPQGVETISDYAFNRDYELEYINIPETVKKIGNSAFLNTKLYTDQADEMFVYVGKNVPKNATGTNKLWIVKVNEDSADDDAKKSLAFSRFEENTAGIADYAFADVKSFNQIMIPSYIEYIGDYAFYESSFWSVVLEGSTVDNATRREPVYIGSYAFAKMKSLSNLLFCDKSDTGATRYPAVKEIGDHAFYNSSQVQDSFCISETLERVGGYAFSGTKIEADSDGVKYIGTDSSSTARWVVGNDSSKLAAKVTLDEKVRGVADYAFTQASTLQTVDNLYKATYVGEGAFYRCKLLEAVALSESITEIADYTFYGCASLTRIGDAETYYESLQSIGRSAFYECDALASLNLSWTKLEYIGKYAFFNCSHLREINFNTTDERLVEIDDCAFYKSGLSGITLPSTVERIGSKAFYKCTDLTNLTILDSSEHDMVIGDYAFYKAGYEAPEYDDDGNLLNPDRENLETLVIPGKVKEIGNYAFYKCKGVTSLTLREGVEKIDKGAFGELSITSLRIPSSVTEIGEYAFKGCSEVKSLIIPSTAMTIGDHAFYGMSGATFYTDAEDYLGEWSSRLNSSYRPMVWGCELGEDENGPYVYSVTVTEDTFANVVRLDPAEGEKTGYEKLCGAPVREGYEFAGWATTPGGGAVYTAEDMDRAPVGTTLYAVWVEVES